MQHAYGYFVDKAQWRSLADLFAEMRTLEIGGKGVFLGKDRVFEYMHVGLGPIGPHDGLLIDHQQFQCLPTVARRRRARFDPLHRLRHELRRLGPQLLRGPLRQGKRRLEVQEAARPVQHVLRLQDRLAATTPSLNTYPEKFPPPPDLPPTVIYLTYPNYYIEPYDYPNPVTGKPMPPPSPRAGGVDFGR